jgi:hypothetical protein
MSALDCLPTNQHASFPTISLSLLIIAMLLVVNVRLIRLKSLELPRASLFFTTATDHGSAAAVAVAVVSCSHW